MSELAFNINGEAFEVPAHASGWRVRRMRAKGAPEVVYGRDGLPLVLPIEAELDDLRAEVDTVGRYRLDLVDQSNKPIADVPSGYVHVNPQVTPPAAATTTTTTVTKTDSIVIEAMRMNAEITKSMIERFPQMMESAAVLLRAADGAGLPARMPIPYEEYEGEEDEQEAGSSIDLNAVIAQLMPLAIAALGSGKLKMPPLGALFDWRKAAKKPAAPSPTPAAPKASPVTSPAAPTEAPAVAPDASTMVKVLAIQAALTPEELAYVQAAAKELSPAELRTWFDELSQLSVPDAVTRIRGLIAGKPATGGVS